MDTGCLVQCNHIAETLVGSAMSFGRHLYVATPKRIIWVEEDKESETNGQAYIMAYTTMFKDVSR